MSTPAAARCRVAVLGLAGLAVAVLCPPDASAANPTPQACGDATNPLSQTAACAAINQGQFNSTYSQLSGKYGTERDPSPTKNVFPSGNRNNGVRVPNYGIPALTNTPSPNASRVNTNIGGVPAANVGNPPTIGVMRQTGVSVLKSKSFPGLSKRAMQLAKVKKSAQNIWAAQETLAHWKASTACSGKSGPGLVTCAEAYERPDTTHPFLASGSHTCEDFVYNRYYDIERWTDRTNACGEDALCKATITLDRTDGIAGNLLSGSDVDPGKRQALQGLLDRVGNYFVSGHATGGKPDCTKAGLKGNDLVICESANSLPPTAHIVPAIGGPNSGPIAGGGATMSSSVCLGSPCPPQWYVVTKNPFYDAKAMFTPLLLAAFSKDQTKYQSVQRLVAELGNSQGYGVGAGQKYPDEWAFQRHMLGLNQNTSERTFHDYAKRKQFLQQRAEAFSLLFNPLAAPKISFGIPASAVGQIRGAAPGGLLGAVQSANAYPTPDVDPPTSDGAEPDPTHSTRFYRALAASVRTQPPSAVDTFAWNNGSNPPQLDPSFAYPRLLCYAPDNGKQVLDKLQPGYSTSFTGMLSGGHAMPDPLPMTPINGPALQGTKPVPNRAIYSDVGTAACNYINAVLDEWARKDMPQALAPNDKAPNPTPAASGCFAGDPACDWDPRDFMEGMEDLVHSQIKNVEYPTEERDYKFCNMWWPTFLAQKTLPDQDKPERNTEYGFLGLLKSKLQGAYNQISKVPLIDGGPGAAGSPASRPVPWTQNDWKASYPDQAKNDTFAIFGEDRANAETWGNDLFGVGYSYDVGWEIPLEWQPSQLPAGAGSEVCNFGAGAHGGFEAYAYAFGSDKFDILNADIAAGFNDYEDAPVPGASSQSTINTDMERANGAFDMDFAVAGDDLYSKTVAMPATGWNVTPTQGSNSWTLFNIPFQISFVTVDVSVGIGYTYEVNANVTPTNLSNQCIHGNPPTDKKTGKAQWPALTTKPSLQLESGLDAQGELDGNVDASATIAGLAGIGVDCDITLLAIGVPAHVTGTVDARGLSIDSSLNMDLRSLSGSLSVYAEALGFTLFSVTILQWDGLHARVPLFNTDHTASFGDLNVLGQTGIHNPAHALMGL